MPPATLDIQVSRASEDRQIGAMRRPARRRRWLLPIAGLLAASLLIGVSTTWTPCETDQPMSSSPASQPVAAINAENKTLLRPASSMHLSAAKTAANSAETAVFAIESRSSAASVSKARPSRPATVSEKPWDDALDEQIGQFGRQVVDAKQSTGSGTGQLVGFGIAQMQRDLEGNEW
jgi:hypothetical protein